MEITGTAVAVKDGKLICSCNDGNLLEFDIIENNIRLDERPQLQYSQDGNHYSIFTADLELPSEPKGSSNSKSPSFHWKCVTTDNEMKNPTKLLFSECERLFPCLGSGSVKTKSVMWKLISETFKENNYDVDAQQIENRFKTLRREYMKQKNHNNSTGRNRKTFEYENEMEKLLGDKASTVPPITYSSTSGVGGREATSRSSSVSSPTASSSSTNTSSNVATPESFDPIVEDEQEEAARAGVVITEEKRSKLGKTARNIEMLNSTLCTIAKEMSERASEKRKMQVTMMELHEQEIEATKRFREDVLRSKKEKLELMKNLFGSRKTD